MALKLLKGIWFLSMVTALGALLYVYAGLPQDVIVQKDGVSQTSVSNEVFFYTVMVLLAIANVMVFIIAKVFAENHDFRAWFYGLIMTLNIFFIIALVFISQYNSNEKFDYDRIAFVIYGSVGLVVSWAASWPIYRIFRALNSRVVV